MHLTTRRASCLLAHINLTRVLVVDYVVYCSCQEIREPEIVSLKPSSSVNSTFHSRGLKTVEMFEIIFLLCVVNYVN